jgi:hypothetical protein
MTDGDDSAGAILAGHIRNLLAILDRVTPGGDGEDA